jgi:hypothetical protein
MRRINAAYVISALLLLHGGPAGAQDNNQKLKTVDVSGTVESVDREKRTVTVRDDQGNDLLVQVPQDVPGFDRLKKGAPARVSYRQSVALSIIPTGGSPASAQRRTPNGRQVVVSAEITKIDSDRKSVELELPDGNTKEVTVQDPALLRRIEEMKPGSTVDVTYTEAIATAVEAANR